MGSQTTAEAAFEFMGQLLGYAEEPTTELKQRLGMIMVHMIDTIIERRMMQNNELAPPMTKLVVDQVHKLQEDMKKVEAFARRMTTEFTGDVHEIESDVKDLKDTVDGNMRANHHSIMQLVDELNKVRLQVGKLNADLEGAAVSLADMLREQAARTPNGPNGHNNF